MSYDYLRDAQAIYDESFRQIELELAPYKLDAGIKPIIARMVHACGIPQIVPDIAYSADFLSHAQAALGRIFVDVNMVKAGIIQRLLPKDSQIITTLDAPQVPDLALRLATTRSAAAVELWPSAFADNDGDALAGSLVVIGNAPTALFHLLEGIEQGRFARPAAIIGIPVGFVGAQESKLALAQSGLCYLTLHGKIGGSAIAAAAVNAVALSAKPQS